MYESKISDAFSVNEWLKSLFGFQESKEINNHENGMQIDQEFSAVDWATAMLEKAEA